MSRKEIKISGYGGQGVITLAKLITAAVIMHSELEAVQTESYGAAARGGSCWAEVVIDEEEIDYPRAVPGNIDIGIFFTDEAVGSFLKSVKKKGGTIIYDPLAIKKVRSKKAQTLYAIPALETAKKEFSPVVANVIMFGAVLGLTNVLSKEIGRKAVEGFVPKKAVELNLKAFERGYQMGQELKAQ
ncbi:MAG: 2-oxoacid:acceptor oxidoreductase family protein [Candidatus Helarchaeota archaeon]|nr:2-oxoacid:acceptor oxidoreductase family protein [Candidatus Helarchaeota archaeon]